MSKLKSKSLVTAAMMAALATSGISYAADEPSVDIEFSYRSAAGEKKTGKTSFSVEADAVSPSMKASILVLSAGRTIQTFVRDWGNQGLEEPTLFATAEQKPVAHVAIPEVLDLPLPPPVKEPEVKEPSDENPRGKRFAAAVRAYKSKLDSTIEKLELQKGSALHKQFTDLDRDLDSLATAFEQAQVFRPRGGIVFRGAPGGPVAAAAEARSLSPKGMAVTSGGTMTDGPFWEKVRSGYVPSLEQFNLDGFIKRFRLTGSTELPEGADKHPLLAVGDAYYNPKSDRVILKLGTLSTLEEDKFVRPPLNLVVALDISGSMTSDDTGAGKNRLAGAKEALVHVVRNLRADDRVAILTFDQDSKVLVEPTLVSDVKKDDLIGKINSIQSGGSTDVGKAQALGYEKLEAMAEASDGEKHYQNRLVLITDANANTGEVDNDALTLAANRAANSSEPIYTTVIGLGRGFNQTLSEKLAENPGGMFYYTASGEDLYKLLTHFDTRMITFATQFAAKIKLHGFPEGAEIVAVHGSGVKDPKQAAKVGGPLEGKRVLDIPTLAFADSVQIDPFAGGGAFFIEVGFKARR